MRDDRELFRRDFCAIMQELPQLWVEQGPHQLVVLSPRQNAAGEAFQKAQLAKPCSPQLGKNRRARAAKVMARLLSLNVGLPRDVRWQGRTVHTGIWKEPVQGRRIVRRLNIDGDGQGDLAGHGGEHRAVFVYQIESYRYWQNQLGRTDPTHGEFGENFTVEGLPDDEVCIGDRNRVGSALFEVTQPALPATGSRPDE